MVGLTAWMRRSDRMVNSTYQTSGNLSRSAGTVVVRSDTPGVEPDHFAFGGFCITAQGDFLTSYRSSVQHARALYDSTVVCKKSTDGGATWGSEVTIFDESGKDPRSPMLTTLADGTILCTGTYWYSAVRFSSGFWSSSDHGATWSARTDFAPSSFIDPGDFCAGPIIELANGDLLVALYGILTAGTLRSCLVMKSTDDGATWSELSTIDGADYSDAYGFVEPNMLLLDTGDIYMAITSFDSQVMAWATSTDSGATWDVTETAIQSAGRAAVQQITSGAMVWCSRSSSGASQMYRTSWDRGQTWFPEVGPGILDTGSRGVYSQMQETERNVLGVAWGMEPTGAGDAYWSFAYLYDNTLPDPMPT